MVDRGGLFHANVHQVRSILYWDIALADFEIDDETKGLLLTKIVQRFLKGKGLSFAGVMMERQTMYKEHTTCKSLH